jgi:hypothetical protein
MVEGKAGITRVATVKQVPSRVASEGA